MPFIERICLGDGSTPGFVVLDSDEVLMIEHYTDFMGEDWEPGGNPDDVAAIVAGPLGGTWLTIEVDPEDSVAVFH